jgi:hypothetical protein
LKLVKLLLKSVKYVYWTVARIQTSSNIVD